MKPMTSLQVLSLCLAVSGRVRLGPSQRVPNTCSTTSNTPCVFPFTHQGVVYSSCTTVELGVSWCSTNTDLAGEHVPGSEGLCPADCTSDSSSSSSSSSSCIPGTLSS